MLAVAAPAQQDAEVDLAELAAQGRWEELIEASSARLAVAPGEPAALYWSGRAHLERGRALLAGPRFAQDLGRSLLRGAAESFAAVPADIGAFQDAPDWAVFSRYLAGDDEELATDLERAAEGGSGYAARLRGRLGRDRDEPGAEAWFARAAQALPNDPEVRLEWAAALAALGRRAEALAALEEARTLGADRDAWLATLLATLPEPADAQELLQQLQPWLAEPGSERDAPLAAYLAWALDQIGRPTEAEAVLARATDARHADVDRQHAALLMRLHRPEAAARMLAPRAADGDAEALDLLVTAADALSQAFQWDEALTTYDEALGIEPAHARAAANRALTQARAGRAPEGYRALVQAHPERPDVLNDAALAEAGQGRDATARSLLERAATRPVDQAGALDARENLADLLLKTAEPDEAAALALLEEVLLADPGRDRALSLRIRALRQTR